jgi:hypothetical protein
MTSYNGFNARNSALAFVFSVLVSATLLVGAGIPETAIAAPAPVVTPSA